MARSVLAIFFGMVCLMGSDLANATPQKPKPSLSGASLSGDRVDGVGVITKLNVENLSAGQHRFWFRVSDNNVGQGWYVPIIVLKGAQEGPRFLLTAGIHGDELNGVGVIHALVKSVDPQSLKGTIIAIPGLNTPGMINKARNLVTSNAGGDFSNLNRIMPGNLQGDSFAERYAGSLWDSIIEGQADFAIDLHTQSTGVAYPLYVFADFTVPEIKKMAELLGPDMIKIDKGDVGILETTLSQIGVPTVTFELGSSQVFDKAMIDRGLEGVLNVLKHKGMLAGAPSPPAKPPIIGNQAINVRSDVGGFATVLVNLMDVVGKDQPIATIADAFGRPRATLVAPVSGHVVSIATDPLCEPGSMLVRILTTNPDPSCVDGC
jgi:predicted deacylase